MSKGTEVNVEFDLAEPVERLAIEAGLDLSDEELARLVGSVPNAAKRIRVLLEDMADDLVEAVYMPLIKEALK